MLNSMLFIMAHILEHVVNGYVIEHYYLDATSEPVIIAIDGNAVGRVAAHFERLVKVDT